ncbi:MAG: helix-turn-helix transcriptional regulator [Clostridia bacterium]|nr:helix-turn-helix transcriptional regulator [Clostridia bacterium]
MYRALLQSASLTAPSRREPCHKAELERTQLNNFCKNKVTRLDTDVLARICCALGCKIEDILEYIPPEDDNK